MTDLLKQIAHNPQIIKPVIYGLKSTTINDEEKDFFSKNCGVGFILFSRNIADKNQLTKLCASLREIAGGEVLILIDQEGGRVARLAPPHWPSYPTGKYFADLYQHNKDQALSEIYQNYQFIAQDLCEIGINVNCAPVLDILSAKTHAIIGDRALGLDANQVSDLGQKVCAALLSKNVYPVIKHIPGHGRGMADSHLELPIVDEKLNNLLHSDFMPFKALNQQKFAMTAHILYTDIDDKNCATTSKKCIDLIRHKIEFKNILMTDDLSMKALTGNFASRAQNALDAGCDLILHCNGDMNEMLQINASLPYISDDLRQKFN